MYFVFMMNSVLLLFDTYFMPTSIDQMEDMSYTPCIEGDTNVPANSSLISGFDDILSVFSNLDNKVSLLF